MLAESVRPLTPGSAGPCNLDPAQYRHVPVPSRLVQVRILCLAGLGCGCPPSGTDTNGPHQGEDPPVGSVGAIPNEQTPAAALSTATVQHTELVRITRNFGKSNFRPFGRITNGEPIVNVAGQPAFAAAQRELRERIDRWMRDTADPRVDPAYDAWDTYRYFGGSVLNRKPKTQ